MSNTDPNEENYIKYIAWTDRIINEQVEYLTRPNMRGIPPEIWLNKMSEEIIKKVKEKEINK